MEPKMIRCIHRKTGKIKFFPENIASDKILMDKIDFVKQEIKLPGKGEEIKLPHTGPDAETVKLPHTAGGETISNFTNNDGGESKTNEGKKTNGMPEKSTDLSIEALRKYLQDMPLNGAELEQFFAGDKRSTALDLFESQKSKNQ